MNDSLREACEYILHWQASGVEPAGAVDFAVATLDALESQPIASTDIHTREQELIADGCDLADALDKCMQERDAAQNQCATAERELNQAWKDLAQRDRRIAAMTDALQSIRRHMEPLSSPIATACIATVDAALAAPASPVTTNISTHKLCDASPATATATATKMTDDDCCEIGGMDGVHDVECPGYQTPGYDNLDSHSKEQK